MGPGERVLRTGVVNGCRRFLGVGRAGVRRLEMVGGKWLALFMDAGFRDGWRVESGCW